MDNYVTKLNAVKEWQRFYNMVPREDSQLTKLYCTDQLPPSWSADVVARELVATDFIYQHTLYGEMLEEFMRVVAKRLKQKYGLTWKSTWDIVKFYGPIACKLLSLERCGLAIPQHYPSYDSQELIAE